MYSISIYVYIYIYMHIGGAVNVEGSRVMPIITVGDASAKEATLCDLLATVQKRMTPDDVLKEGKSGEHGDDGIIGSTYVSTDQGLYSEEEMKKMITVEEQQKTEDQISRELDLELDRDQDCSDGDDVSSDDVVYLEGERTTPLRLTKRNKVNNHHVAVVDFGNISSISVSKDSPEGSGKHKLGTIHRGHSSEPTTSGLDKRLEEMNRDGSSGSLPSWPPRERDQTKGDDDDVYLNRW
jgi:hypothetical protein